MIRHLFALVALLVVAGAVVRNGGVRALSVSDPAAAARLWSGHPLVIQDAAMAGVGEAARTGQAAGPGVIRLFDELAVKEPLSVEPLLVNAVSAQNAGEMARAERLFILAERRQGRSLPPHFFLADLYLRSGRSAEGLREVVNLARLASNGISSGAPYIAQYAQDPANWPQIRNTFRDQPDLVDPVLTALAVDPANARAILALANGPHRSAEAVWLGPLLRAMTGAGQYRQARALWAGIANVGPAGETLIYDSEFKDGRSPPPYNWELAESPVGLAERRDGAGLHVIFYGSQGGMLVRQLLILPPGTYRLAMRASGQIADPLALTWSVLCDKAKEPLKTFALRGPGSLAGFFTVPPGCPAQRLELNGRAQDISGRSDIVISGLSLTRGGGGEGGDG